MSTMSTLRRWMAGAAITVAAATAGAAPVQDMDHDMMGARLGTAYERAVSDGTPDQKARMHALMQAAQADLQPLRQQLREAHRQVLQLLAQPAIDRPALEALRASQLQVLDQMSRRLLRAGEDAADLMTPAQRARFFNERMQNRGNY